jgi:hypothetical protein
MKNPYEVLHTHEQRIVHVRQEIEALRLVIELLDEDEQADTLRAAASEIRGIVAISGEHGPLERYARAQ